MLAASDLGVRAESLPLYSLSIHRIDTEECFKSADVRLRQSASGKGLPVKIDFAQQSVCFSVPFDPTVEET
jgi:hypothetical protein